MEYAITISTIDSHIGGSGVRLVTDGVPFIPGASIAEKLRYAKQEVSWLPELLFTEPRGHKNLQGAIMLPPCDPDAQVGVLFLNGEGYDPAIDNAMIGVITSLVEMGLVEPHGMDGQLILDTLGGLVQANVVVDEGRAREVTFENIPAFVLQMDLPVHLDSGQVVEVDIAFGGRFYALVDVAQLGVQLETGDSAHLAELGVDIFKAVNAQVQVRHPLGIYDERIDGILFIQPAWEGGNMKPGLEVTGDGVIKPAGCVAAVCAEMAMRYFRDQLPLWETFSVSAGRGASLTFCVVGDTAVEGGDDFYPAVIPQITGSAYLSGFHQFVVQFDDPYSPHPAN